MEHLKRNAGSDITVNILGIFTAMPIVAKDKANLPHWRKSNNSAHAYDQWDFSYAIENRVTSV